MIWSRCARMAGSERVISGAFLRSSACVSRWASRWLRCRSRRGFRVMSAAVDRGTAEGSSALTWVRDQEGGGEITGTGSTSMFRTEVLAALLSDGDPTAPLGESVGTDELRTFIGQRYLLLSPLFGLTLRQLVVGADDEARMVVFHDGIEEVVPPSPSSCGRFLRARVVDALNAARGRTVSIDLEQAAEARTAFEEGRYDDVLAKLAGWVAPLMMYQRTPEGSSLDPGTRADISRALGVLGRTFFKLGRPEESEETLRLAVQYAHDSPAAAEIYRMLARTMIDGERLWTGDQAAAALAGDRARVAGLPGGSSVVFREDEPRGWQRTGAFRKARKLGKTSEQLEAVEAEVRAAPRQRSGEVRGDRASRVTARVETGSEATVVAWPVPCSDLRARVTAGTEYTRDGGVDGHAHHVVVHRTHGTASPRPSRTPSSGA